TSAILAGFLLTAVGNWTGRETAVGGPLVALVALWAGARVALFALPGWGSSILDLAFLPALALTLARPLIATGNRRNAIFPILLLGMAAANLVVHLDALGLLRGWAAPAHRLAVHLIVLIILAVTGRVVPM